MVIVHISATGWEHPNLNINSTLNIRTLWIMLTWTEITNSCSNIFACLDSEYGIFTCGNGTGAKHICSANLSTFKWDAAIISAAQLINSSMKSTSTSNSSAPCVGFCECSKEMVSLGAGLGVGLGLPFIMVLFWHWRFCRRISRDKKTQPENRIEHDDIDSPQLQQGARGYHRQLRRQLVEVDAMNHTLRELEWA